MDATAYHTFKNGRKCRKCGSPIADQEHKLRKYCRTKRLPDGTVDSCKDDYHSPIRKEQNMPFLRMAKHHKTMHQRIRQLRQAKGEMVKIDDLNLWGIVLKRPYQFEIKDGIFVFYFHEFAITELGNKTYQISSHGLF